VTILLQLSSDYIIYRVYERTITETIIPVIILAIYFSLFLNRLLKIF